MASREEATESPSPPVVDYWRSVVYGNLDDKALAKKLSDKFYSQFLVDKKHVRSVRTRGFFQDCPTLETEYFYISAVPPNLDDDDPNETDSESDEEEDGGMDCGGFWMLFFSKDIIDDMWERACKLLRDGRLEGVNYILVSTSRQNPRANDYTNSVMLFHSEPWTDKTFMQCLGHHIAMQMSYFSYTNYLYYKPNHMISYGTRATGNRINSLIRIPVPENILGVLKKKKRLNWVLNKPKRYQTWLLDQRVDYRKFSGEFCSVRFRSDRSTETLPKYEYKPGS